MAGAESVDVDELPEPDTDTVLVCGRASGKTPALHVPSEDGTPICDRSLEDKTYRGGWHGGKQKGNERWVEKDVAVYPGPWREWCSHCKLVLAGEAGHARTSGGAD